MLDAYHSLIHTYIHAYTFIYVHVCMAYMYITASWLADGVRRKHTDADGVRCKHSDRLISTVAPLTDRLTSTVAGS